MAEAFYILALYGSLNPAKKVDEDLYQEEAPTVDIMEDQREEDFRLDINSWTLDPAAREKQLQQKKQEELLKKQEEERRAQAAAEADDQEKAVPEGAEKQGETTAASSSDSEAPELKCDNEPTAEEAAVQSVPAAGSAGMTVNSHAQQRISDDSDAYSGDYVNPHTYRTAISHSCSSIHSGTQEQKTPNESITGQTLKLDLTDLGNSLSSDTLGNSHARLTARSASARFYEEFRQPNSNEVTDNESVQSYKDQMSSNNTLGSSHQIGRSSTPPSDLCTAPSDVYTTPAVVHIATLEPLPTDAYQASVGEEPSGVEYITRIRFKDTGAQNAASIKASKKLTKPKGTVRYAIKSDIGY